MRDISRNFFQGSLGDVQSSILATFQVDASKSDVRKIVGTKKESFEGFFPPRGEDGETSEKNCSRLPRKCAKKPTCQISS